MKGTDYPGQIFLTDLYDCFDNSPKTKSADDYLLECVLIGSGFSNGKERIFNIINSDLSVNEQVDKIKSEYGVGGVSFKCKHLGEPNSLIGYNTGYHNKGLTVRFQDENVEEQNVCFTWSKVRAAIIKQIQDGKYRIGDDR